MCDAIEKMVINVLVEDDKTEFINKQRYWNFGKKTFRDFLFDLKGQDIWEYSNISVDNRPSLHPNKNGYELISEELYSFIKNLNIYI